VAAVVVMMVRQVAAELQVLMHQQMVQLEAHLQEIQTKFHRGIKWQTI
jgi:hypothetical protein